MQRILEFLLGLDSGFLSKEGERVLRFNPKWPFQDSFEGAALAWNLGLGALAVLLVLWVYRREGRGLAARISLAAMRLLLLGLVIALLNRPTLTIVKYRTEPSVLAVLMDSSGSMNVRDAGAGLDGGGISRFQAMLNLLDGEDRKLIADLGKRHTVKFYRFDRDAQEVPPTAIRSTPATRPAGSIADEPLRPDGGATQVLTSLRTVLEELQGQRLAGVVLLTDGRNSPPESLAEKLDVIKEFNVRVYPVAIGSDKPPRNIAIDGVAMEEAAFAGDMVSAKVHLRTSGFQPGHSVTVVLKDKATGATLQRADGKPAEQTVTVAGDGARDVEVNFMPGKPGTLQVVAEAVHQVGEVDADDNSFPKPLEVLDSKIAVLYVDGYPRWDYRYLRDELLRDKKNFSFHCLLLSADTGLAMDGHIPRFPESMTEMLAYDVVLFGDVDSRQFTDAQLQLVADFVLKKNGGFGMVAGPKWSPYSYRSTPIEAVLPVSIRAAEPEDETAGNIPAGFRPILSKAGESSTIFRFFENKEQNDKYLKEDLQPLFWYCRKVAVKRDVGEAYAEHPTDVGPDGRKAPVLVLGRYGGRTLFSAIDDSWRWRFYTGGQIFRNYWIQQIRYLAREKKLGQRRFTIVPMRPSYTQGEQIEVHLRVLDPDLLQQLPDQISVLVTRRGANGDDQQAVWRETLQRRAGQNDLYVASWTADRVGSFALKLPALAGNTDAVEVPIQVKSPKLELTDPAVDRGLLSKLVSKDTEEPGGPQLVKLRLDGETPLAVVRAELVKIPSAQATIPEPANRLLWTAPLAMALFVLLVTIEWVLRKVYGML